VKFSREAQQAIASARRLAAAEALAKATPQHLARSLCADRHEAGPHGQYACADDREATTLLNSDLVRVLTRSVQLSHGDVSATMVCRKHLLAAIRDIVPSGEFTAALDELDADELTDHPASRQTLKVKAYKASARNRTEIDEGH
jgi:hypothetical protein